MKTKAIAFLMIMAMAFFGLFGIAQAADKPVYKVAWSHYTGWEPLQLAKDLGILDKWAEKNGIKVELQIFSYMDSINVYSSGEFQAVAITNMDVLTTPAVGGVDSEVIAIGDFSNGNDGVVMKKGKKVADIMGRQVHLVEFSVSHYLMSRMLSMDGKSENDIRIVNVSNEDDIPPLFKSSKDAIVVTWNPLLMNIRSMDGANMVFDSSKIPGEIIDMLVVKSDAPEAFKKALTGAWYEVMQIMSGTDAKSKEAIQLMAKSAGSTEAEFLAQLKTTAMFYKAEDAANFAESPKLKETMEYVRSFCFSHGLYGKAKSKDAIGIMFPDGTTIGDPNHVKLRYTSKYMRLAAEGKLK